LIGQKWSLDLGVQSTFLENSGMIPLMEAEYSRECCFQIKNSLNYGAIAIKHAPCLGHLQRVPGMEFQKHFLNGSQESSLFSLSLLTNSN
jgi:hypothetical protein